MLTGPPRSDAETTLPVLRRVGALVREWTTVPNEAALLDAQRDTVLMRTRAGSWLAAVVIPFTITVHTRAFAQVPFLAGSTVALGAEVAIALILYGLHAGIFAKRYHLPLFLLAAVCNITEAVLLQLSGGGASSNFVFPYFLILFGIAALFPARLSWATAAVLLSPVTYVVSELVVRRALASGPAVTTLILLVDYAFIAVFANRVTTRIFFREVEHRLALETANRQLRELDKAKTDFFANLSHDLRSPLTAIIGPLNAIAPSQHLDSSERMYLEMALRGATKLDAMINDLLEIARIDAGVGKLHRARLELSDMIEELVDSSRPYAATLGLTLDSEAPEATLWISADQDKLERVLMNLLSNAAKFSPMGTTVRMGARRDADGVLLWVADQGPGIAPAQQTAIFTRFARGQGEEQRTRGAGLGLAVVKEFVELHGGKVWVESELGKGSTFYVRLPLEVLSTEALPAAGDVRVRPRPPVHLLLPPRAQGRFASAGSQVPRLLLAEDGAELTIFLAGELGHDFQVLATESGPEALDRAVKERPDIVLADVMLPGMDGLELCRRLRADAATATVPILVFSARGDLQTRLDAFEAGADDFLPKPFHPRELQARLHALLRRGSRRPTPASPSSKLRKLPWP